MPLELGYVYLAGCERPRWYNCFCIEFVDPEHLRGRSVSAAALMSVSGGCNKGSEEREDPNNSLWFQLKK